MTKQEAAEKIKSWIRLGSETTEAFDILLREAEENQIIDQEPELKGGVIDAPHTDVVDAPPADEGKTLAL